MKVLAAEDNPVFQAMLRNMLTKWGYEVVVVSDGDAAWEHLSGRDGQEPPRLAILDWMMPGTDGVELCRRLRTSKREPYIYVILLTARTQSEDLVAGMEAGADDYLTKPFNTHELRVRLRAGQRILDLQQELLVAREVLRRQATQDYLTGLWNRRSVYELVENEVSRAAREKAPLAVLMIDLDHFKAINDTHGHTAGDMVLREAAQRMRSVMRRYDSIGRYGGEEFLAVLPNCDRLNAAAQAERLRDSLSHEPIVLPTGPLTVTCSIGVAWALGTHMPQAAAMIREADQALYAAKNNGRNRVECARPPYLAEPGPLLVTTGS